MNRPQTNPFIIGFPAEGGHFADREAEVQRIVVALTDPASRLVVYGDRRQGKTSAILAAAAEARANGENVALVDLAKVTSMEAAAQRVLDAVHRELGKRWTDSAVRLIQRMRNAQVSISTTADPTTGAPTVSFSVMPTAVPAASAVRPGQVFVDALNAVEEELRERGETLGLALDEFQRLARWDPEIDWLLKGTLESHRRISYVLAGSEKSLIEQMLDAKKAGLWKVAEILDLQPIPPELFAPWLAERATAGGVALSLEVARQLMAVSGPRTRDVVQLARVLWDMLPDGATATRLDVAHALEVLVTEQSALYLRMWERLESDAHRTLLVLMAHDPHIEPTGTETLRRWPLRPKSTMARIVLQLIDEEHVVREADGSYRFDDPFFRRWIEVNLFRDFGFAVPRLEGAI
jgi:AAA+ ATPase superfamily predicted ATPase